VQDEAGFFERERKAATPAKPLRLKDAVYFSRDNANTTTTHPPRFHDQSKLFPSTGIVPRIEGINHPKVLSYLGVLRDKASAAWALLSANIYRMIMWWCAPARIRSRN
jgi:hypothetical protein